MKNLQYVMDLFSKAPEYKFFYVDTSNGAVVPMGAILINNIVEEYNELLINSQKQENKETTNEVIVMNFIQFASNIDYNNISKLKNWFNGYEEDYDYMYKYYSDVYDVFSKLNFFDNGKLDTETLEKFNEDYDCDLHKIHVSLFYKEDPRVVYIKFEKEIVEDEDC